MTKKVNYLTDLIFRVTRIITIIIGIFFVVTAESWGEIIIIVFICTALVLIDGFVIKKLDVNRSG